MLNLSKMNNKSELVGATLGATFAILQGGGGREVMAFAAYGYGVVAWVKYCNRERFEGEERTLAKTIKRTAGALLGIGIVVGIAVGSWVLDGKINFG